MFLLAPFRNARPTAVAAHVLATAAVIVGASAAHAGEITDQRGRTFTLDKPPHRLIFMPIPAPSTFITIDGDAKKIVGMNSYSATAMRDGIMGKIFPGLSHIKTDVVMNTSDPSSFAPNIESVLALQPDLIFQWATAADNIDALDRLGIPTIGLRVSTNDDFVRYVAIMGQVAGKEQRAATLLQRQNAERERLKKEFGALKPEERPRVLYFNRATNMLRVSGKGTFNDYYIALAGGRNVAGDTSSMSTVTIEQVLTWDPQVILLGNFDDATPADIYADPRWQSIEAVRNRRVYRMPLGGYRWDPPSQESALTWAWLAGLLHPQRDHTDLRAAMRDWYTFLYAHTLTDDEIDAILFMEQNRASAGYERYSRR
ncbi:iron ABC transporter substrate-binding protein [Pseudolabrys taiwanensis]|uniref:Iron ABC transporter substrate-binding protein n=1 Tax=Pseudolabrys taiwanensis TaxID=331696 RepID=A0A346A141_9HYPH|nr:ABC transporter substrate-binding protein [Pseudolabrys taiwanensis]AXK82888.1 iron ABC transporter substrate-binding protein [Pseudolabrys taiwanensis]